MLALVVLLLLLLAGLTVAWRRLDLAQSPLGRVVLVAVVGGVVGAFAIYASMLVQPTATWPAWLVVMSDALLLFPLLVLTQSANETVLSLLAPVLLGLEFSVVILCVMVAMRLVSGSSRRWHGQRRTRG